MLVFEVPSEELAVEVVEENIHYEGVIKELFQNDAVIEYEDSLRPTGICVPLRSIKFPPKSKPFNIVVGKLAEVLVLEPGYRGWYKCSILVVKTNYAKVKYMLKNREEEEMVHSSRIRAFNIEPYLSRRHQYKTTVLLPPTTREFARGCPLVHEDFRRLIGNCYVNYSCALSLVVVRCYDQQCVRRAMVLIECYVEAVTRSRDELTLNEDLERRLITANEKGFILCFEVPEVLKNVTLGPGKWKLKEASNMIGISSVVYQQNKIYIHAVNSRIANNARQQVENFHHTVEISEYTMVHLARSNLRLMIIENEVDVTITGITEPFPNDIPEMDGVVPLTITGTRRHIDMALMYIQFLIYNIEHGVPDVFIDDDSDSSNSDGTLSPPPGEIEVIIVDDSGDGAHLATRFIQDISTDVDMGGDILRTPPIEAFQVDLHDPLLFEEVEEDPQEGPHEGLQEGLQEDLHDDLLLEELQEDHPDDGLQEGHHNDPIEESEDSSDDGLLDALRDDSIEESHDSSDDELLKAPCDDFIEESLESSDEYFESDPIEESQESLDKGLQDGPHDDPIADSVDSSVENLLQGIDDNSIEDFLENSNEYQQNGLFNNSFEEPQLLQEGPHNDSSNESQGSFDLGSLDDPNYDSGSLDSSDEAFLGGVSDISLESLESQEHLQNGVNGDLTEELEESPDEGLQEEESSHEDSNEESEESSNLDSVDSHDDLIEDENLDDGFQEGPSNIEGH